jgi:hypothetical protein
MLSPKKFEKKCNKETHVRDKTESDEKTGDKVFFAVYQRVYEQISDIVSDGTLDFTNVDILIKAGMEAVEYVAQDRVPPMSGTEKAEICKKLVVSVLRDLGDRKVIPKDISDKIILSVNILGPVMFKLIAMATKGKISINNMFTNADGTSKCCIVV